MQHVIENQSAAVLSQDDLISIGLWFDSAYPDAAVKVVLVNVDAAPVATEPPAEPQVEAPAETPAVIEPPAEPPAEPPVDSAPPVDSVPDDLPPSAEKQIADNLRQQAVDLLKQADQLDPTTPPTPEAPTTLPEPGQVQ